MSRRRTARTAFALGLAAGFAAALAAAPAAAQRPPVTGLDAAAGSKPPTLERVGFDQRIGKSVPLDLAFRDEAGRAVTLGDYFGERPVALSLVYYECPMLCPMTLDGLARSLKGIAFDAGREFEVVVVSFDPGEGPAAAAAAEQRVRERYGRPAPAGAATAEGPALELERSGLSGVSDGLHFLTGGESAIASLAAAVGFRYDYDASRDEYAHGTGLVLLTPEGEISRYFFGIEFGPKDLRLGLVESGQGRLGNPVDQVLLYCFHYDPVVGKYSAATMNLVRAGAVATLLALAAGIAVMVRRDRRQRAGLRTV